MFRLKNWLLMVAAACLAIVLLPALFTGSSQRVKPNTGSEVAAFDPLPAEGQAQKQIKFAVAMSAKEFDILRQLKDQYQSAHPNVFVQLENIAEETAYAKWKKAAQLGEAPDVMLLDNDWVSEFAALGYLLPIDAMLQGGMQHEQMDQALAQVKWNGYMWAVPKQLDLYIVAYPNVRLAEWGGRPPQSSEELLTLHRQAHRPEEGKYGLYADIRNSQVFVALSRMVGGQAAQALGVPIELRDSSVRRTLETFLTLHADQTRGEGIKPLVKSFPATGPTWRPWEQLAQGTMLGYITTFSDWKQNESGALSASRFPLPKGEEPWKGSWVWGKSLAISAKTEVGAEAFALIRELSSPHAVQKFWQGAGVLPAQSGAYTAEIRSDPAFQTVAIMIDQDAAALRMPQRAGQMDVMKRELERLWRGEQAFQAFADTVATEWEMMRPASP